MTLFAINLGLRFRASWAKYEKHHGAYRLACDRPRQTARRLQPPLSVLALFRLASVRSRRIGTKGRMGGGGTGNRWILAECHKVSEEGA